MIGGIVLITLFALRGRERSASVVAAAGAGLYIFAGAYVLPWYVFLALPLAAIASRSWVAKALWWQSLALVVAYVYRPEARPDRLDVVLRSTSSAVAILQAVALAALAGGALWVLTHNRGDAQAPAVVVRPEAVVQ
jgi:hypothetical protein